MRKTASTVSRARSTATPLYFIICGITGTRAVAACGVCATAGSARQKATIDIKPGLRNKADEMCTRNLQGPLTERFKRWFECEGETGQNYSPTPLGVARVSGSNSIEPSPSADPAPVQRRFGRWTAAKNHFN